MSNSRTWHAEELKVEWSRDRWYATAMGMSRTSELSKEFREFRINQRTAMLERSLVGMLGKQNSKMEYEYRSNWN